MGTAVLLRRERAENFTYKYGVHYFYFGLDHQGQKYFYLNSLIITKRLNFSDKLTLLISRTVLGPQRKKNQQEQNLIPYVPSHQNATKDIN